VLYKNLQQNINFVPKLNWNRIKKNVFWKFTSKELSLCLLVIEFESRLIEPVDRTWLACWRQSSILDNCCSNDGKWKSVERSQTDANSLD